MNIKTYLHPKQIARKINQNDKHNTTDRHYQLSLSALAAAADPRNKRVLSPAVAAASAKYCRSFSDADFLKVLVKQSSRKRPSFTVSA